MKTAIILTAILILAAAPFAAAMGCDDRNCDHCPDCICECPDYMECPEVIITDCPDCVCRSCPDCICAVNECPDCICDQDCPECPPEKECPELEPFDALKMAGIWMLEGRAGVNIGFMRIFWFGEYGAAIQCLKYVGSGVMCTAFVMKK